MSDERDQDHAPGAAGGFYYLTNRLSANMHRYPHVFAQLDPAQRPPKGPGMNILLMGIDTRADSPTTGSDATGPDFVYGRQRSDAILIAHIDPDDTHATVISLPRDSWVPIAGHGKAKINAAFSYGGPTLLVKTVEDVTKMHIDHFAVIDFAGFRSVVDAVGGIDVRVAAPTSSRGVHFHAGLNHLDGAQALVYVRQRHGLPGGDLAREQRHQEAIKALISKAASSGLLSDPVQTYDLLDALTKSISVDDTLDARSLRSLAWQLHGLRGRNIRFVTAPVAGFGTEGGADVVYLDKDGTEALCAATDDGTVERYLAKFPGAELPDTPP